MDNNIQKIIEERFGQLPVDIQKAIASNDLAQKFTAIANKNSLHIDQNGALQNETLLVMLGIEPAKDYVGNLERELEVSRVQAQSIAEDINKEIFMSIRQSLQKIQAENEAAEEIQIEEKKAQPPTPQTQPTPSKPLTPLEKAGGFEIIKDRPVSASPQYNDTNLNKAKILDGIENPPTTPRVSIVDHLLANPVSSTNTTATQTPKAEPIAPQKSAAPATPAPTSPKSADPYRESIE